MILSFFLQSADVSGFFACGSRMIHFFCEKRSEAFSFSTEPNLFNICAVFFCITLVKTSSPVQSFAACLYSSKSHSDRVGSQCSMTRIGGLSIGRGKRTVEGDNNGSCAKKYLNKRSIDGVVVWIE